MSKYFDGDKLSGYEYSPITYVYGGNLEECHKVIADLEAKLAEIEESARAVIDANFRVIEERDKLKQQLAEKDKEIERLKTMTGYRNDKTRSTIIDGIKFTDEQIIVLNKIGQIRDYCQNQKAIEELEKVKFKFPDKTFAIVIGEEENSKTMFVSDYVDQRIKELKGE